MAFRQEEIRRYVVFRITPEDVPQIQGESLQTVAQRTVKRLTLVMDEAAEQHDRGHLIKSALLGIMHTCGLTGLIWILVRNRRWAEERLIRLTADKAGQLKSHTLRIFGLQNIVPILRSLMTAAFWIIVGLASYLWLELVLRLVPQTRVLGEQLGSRFFDLLAALGQNIIHTLPDLGIVFCVWVAARFASSAVRRFFSTVARGNVKSHLFDSVTAPITQRLFVCLIWAVAFHARLRLGRDTARKEHPRHARDHGLHRSILSQTLFLNCLANVRTPTSFNHRRIARDATGASSGGTRRAVRTAALPDQVCPLP